MTQLIEEKAFDDNFACNDVESRIKNEKDGTITITITHPTPISLALVMATPMAKFPTTAPRLLFPSIRAVPDHKDDVQPIF